MKGKPLRSRWFDRWKLIFDIKKSITNGLRPHKKVARFKESVSHPN